MSALLLAGCWRHKHFIACADVVVSSAANKQHRKDQQLYAITICCNHLSIELLLSECCYKVSLESKGPEAFQTARGCCIPFGVMELAIGQLPQEQQQRFGQLLHESESAPVEALDNIANQLQVGHAWCNRVAAWQIPREQRM